MVKIALERKNYLNDINNAFKNSKLVALLGPRQCGKTTLARQFFTKHNGQRSQYFDLENPTDLLRLSDPLLALEEMQGLIIIDEIQRIPNLFPVLRVLVDSDSAQQQYLILGSASKELIRQSSESLAGRIHYREVTPFSFGEVADLNKLWIRGGYPRSYLANSIEESIQWRQDYVRTFLEQDIPNLGINLPAEQLRRFWMMLAHYHGQLLNSSEIGNALDSSHHTVQKYLDILSGTFMIRQLAPWYENIAKRQVKTKKIYFRDSGIFHTLLNVSEPDVLSTHPKIGASWEGFALESIIRHLKADYHNCYFWATHNGAELDLLIVEGMRKKGFEFKFTKTPKITRSMLTAIEDLKLDHLTVIYPGGVSFKLNPKITCVGLEEFLAS